MKTKKEYMKEYKAKNPQILVCAILSLVFDVIGFLIISALVQIFKILKIWLE